MKNQYKSRVNKMELTIKQIRDIIKFYEEYRFLPWEKKKGLKKLQKWINLTKKEDKRLQKFLKKMHEKDIKRLEKIKKMLINDKVPSLKYAIGKPVTISRKEEIMGDSKSNHRV